MTAVEKIRSYIKNKKLFSKDKGKRGFVGDTLTMFIVLTVVTIVMLIVLYISHTLSTALADQPGIEEYNNNFLATLDAMDYLIPVLVGMSLLVMFTTAYTSQSHSAVIVLFVMYGLIMLVVINYMNVINTEFWEAITTKDPSINWPYTKAVIDNFPIIAALGLFITAILIHGRGKT